MIVDDVVYSWANGAVWREVVVVVVETMMMNAIRWETSWMSWKYANMKMNEMLLWNHKCELSQTGPGLSAAAVERKVEWVSP